MFKLSREFWLHLSLRVLFYSVVLLYLFYFLVPSKDTKTVNVNTSSEPSTYLFMGIDDKASNCVRGRNDVTMLILDYSNHIHVIGFPRETLIDIPTKGYYRINGLYPFLTAFGAVRALEHIFNINIDNFYAVDLSGFRDIVKSLPFINKNSKDESWIRHRKTIKMEIGRQFRVQSYLQRSLRIMKKLPLSKSLLSLILSKSIATDIKNSEEVTPLISSFKNKKVVWSIYPGKYERIRSSYSFFHHRELWVYQIAPENFNIVATNLCNDTNPYKFNNTNINTSREVKSDLFRINWAQKKFKEYSSKGIINISSEYKAKTNKRGLVTYLLK